jgi:hypothetical protein
MVWWEKEYPRRVVMAAAHSDDAIGVSRAPKRECEANPTVANDDLGNSMAPALGHASFNSLSELEHHHDHLRLVWNFLVAPPGAVVKGSKSFAANPSH